MASYAPTFNTIYEKPIVKPPKVSYGQNIVFIGLAEDGPYNSLTYVTSPIEARKSFVGGDIVNAFEEAYAAGARYIYLIRLKELNLDNLIDALAIILDYEIHIIVPIGMYFDDETDYASVLVNFCSLKREYGEAIAVMGVRPIETSATPVNIDDLVDAKITSLWQNQRARTGWEEGYYLSVMATELLLFEGTTKERYSDGVATYAALLSLVLPGHSPVNKRIASNPQLRYSLLNSSKTEIVALSNQPYLLKRRPIEGTVSAKRLDGTLSKEYVDFIVNYDEGTVVAHDYSGTIEITYGYNDIDTLASAGFATMTNFVKNGAAVATSVTMSKNSISLVQDIRVMQSVAEHIREIGLENMIGNVSVSIDHLDSYIGGYIDNLIETYQISAGTYSILRSADGKDLSIEVEIQPREAVRAQTFYIRLPLVNS